MNNITETSLKQIRGIAEHYKGREKLTYLMGLREGIGLATQCYKDKVDPDNFPPVVEFAQYVEDEIDKASAEIAKGKLK